MKEKRKSIFRKRSGVSAIEWLFVSAALMILVSLVVSYLRTMIIVRKADHDLQKIIITQSVENYDNTFATNREGYTSGFQFDDVSESFLEQELTDTVGEKLTELGLMEEGGTFRKYAASATGAPEVVYGVTNISLDFDSIIQGESKFEAEYVITLEVPFKWGGQERLIHPTLTKKAIWLQKFE